MSFLRRREEVIVCNVVLLDGSNIRIDVPVSFDFLHSFVCSACAFHQCLTPIRSMGVLVFFGSLWNVVLRLFLMLFPWHREMPQEVCCRGGPIIS